MVTTNVNPRDKAYTRLAIGGIQRNTRHGRLGRGIGATPYTDTITAILPLKAMDKKVSQSESETKYWFVT